MGAKTCVNCKSLLPAEAVFCSDCGSYQGQREVDENRNIAGGEAEFVPMASASDPALRPCPNCGVLVSAIAAACTNCFRLLPPLTAPSVAQTTAQLRKPSRALVWFLMGSAVLVFVGYIVLEILVAVFAGGHPTH